jgi:hypothetical protein
VAAADRIGAARADPVDQHGNALGSRRAPAANGLADGYLFVPGGRNKTSNYDPGIGLRYQF